MCLYLLQVFRLEHAHDQPAILHVRQFGLPRLSSLLTCFYQYASSLLGREFFRTNYAELKTLNPGFPILLREGTGADPYLLATYGASQGSQPLVITMRIERQDEGR